MTDVRVRFPPSPTGYLHIGSARTALYNWLFARKHGGTLVLRIEDTDTERSTEEAERAILDGLEWLGIDWDEGPYRQSEHVDEHKSEAGRLVAEGKAYLCFCTRERIDEKRKEAEARGEMFRYDETCRTLPREEADRRVLEGEPFVVRFKVPRSDEPSVTFDDAVFGRNEVLMREIEDFVIVRSNGTPLYILSNVVDDHRDRITHVIRGQDHLTNTPRQILLYRALGYDLPLFAHMSLTLDPRKAKISKRRHGEVVTVEWYREHGFLPWGLANFIALLGWSPGEDREVFLTRREMIDAFSLEGLSRVNAVFNYRKDDPKFITDPKAIHVNGQHVKTMPLDELLPYVRAELRRSGLWREAWSGEEAEWLARAVDLLRQRYNLLTDFSRLGRPYFGDEIEMEQKALKNLRKDPALAEYLPRLADELEALDEFDVQATERALRDLCDRLDVKAGLVINAARAAVTGQAVGPGIFDVFVILGRERTVSRLRDAAPLVAREPS
jgi:glutamyl-tRNA synthetase